jgi:SsrA-binding protein
MKKFATNPKAHYEFFVLKTIEAGIALSSFDAKGIRLGKASLNGCFAKIVDGNVVLFDMYVGNAQRERRLLLHKKEIIKLEKDLLEASTTLVPLSLYVNKNGKIKIELALCKGKKVYDKKQTIKERDLDRQAKSEY